MASSMADFNLNTAVSSPMTAVTPTGSVGSPSVASASAAAAAASLIHSASQQINDQLSSFSSLAQYGAAAAGFSQLTASPADSLYSASAASSLDNSVSGAGGVTGGLASSVGIGTSTSLAPTGNSGSTSGLSAASGGIASIYVWSRH